MQINKVGMTRNHFQPGNPDRVRMIVMHATAGKAPGDYNWLRQGGSDTNPVSIHYYIDKAGNVSQMVEDKDIAWQAGRSSWVVDGRVVNGCNPVSIGIELENRNTGRDPYPQAQYDAALELVRELVARYNIPRRQLVRHLDIAPRRKTDPAGFPWERFVAQVYAPAPTPTPTPQPTPEPLPPSQQLRKLLVDLAYRAAGGSYPSGWPLLKEAISRTTGMPIAVITAPTPAGDAEGEDDDQRAVVVAGQPLILEAYGRDLFYAPPDHLDQVQRLSETAPGPLRDALLQALFRWADPVKGFRPDQAFHQFFLAHMTEIGVPLGPDHVIAGGRYSCQHYALDTLIWTGKAVVRLSDLTREMYGADPHQPWEKELRTLVLNDLYTTRTGRNFDPGALFCKYAITHGLGAPQGKAEVQILEGQRLVAMPFALDVLYCRIPGDGDWRNVVIGELPGVLGDEEAGLARLSTLLAQGDLDEAAPAVLGAENVEDVLPQQIYTGGLLGAETTAPPVVDLTHNIAVSGEPGDRSIELLVVYPIVGPSGEELAEAARPGATVWHYYIDQAGTVMRLVDEARAAHAAGDASWQGQDAIDQRSLAIAVEGAADGMNDEQAAALAWLLRDLMGRYGLTRGQVIQGADLGLSAAIAGWEQVLAR
jgi:N-acetyl-anhydromuramyl-L-alanine amidase AmpD